MLHLEAVSVSVGYADFLSAVIPYNLPHLDRWIILTEPEDEATREVCRKFGLECFQSRDHRRGGEFAKGRLVERGLQHLSAEGWRLHLDADIALPAHFGRALAWAELQEDTIYGVDRILCRNAADFQRLLKTGWLSGGQHSYSYVTKFPPGFEVGARWISPLVGYVPIGFFQLWHASQDLWHGVRTKPYPERHNTACRTDVQHGLQFDRAQRALLPEIVVAHLESEPCPLGHNWNGRKTRKFCPNGEEEGPATAAKTGRQFGLVS